MRTASISSTALSGVRLPDRDICVFERAAGAILASGRPIPLAGWREEPLPEGVARGQYPLCRRGLNRKQVSVSSLLYDAPAGVGIAQEEESR